MINKTYLQTRNLVMNLAEKVRKMGFVELGNLIGEEDFSKEELRKRYIQIAESKDLHSLLGLKDPVQLDDVEDRNRIWVYTYLLDKKEIKVLPLI